MHVDLEDVLKLIDELQASKTRQALIPNELVHKQYAMLGVVSGIEDVKRKLSNFYGREG